MWHAHQYFETPHTTIDSVKRPCSAWRLSSGKKAREVHASQCRLSSGEAMALKVAIVGSHKHQNLKHQTKCLLALHSLWGQCVPHILLAGELRAHGHGYGLGTTLLHGRHPKSGTLLLLMFKLCTACDACTFYECGMSGATWCSSWCRRHSFLAVG